MPCRVQGGLSRHPTFKDALFSSSASGSCPHERCVDEQAGLLGYDVAGFSRLLKIALPGRIRCQRRSPALAILGILVFPDVDVGIDVSGFGHEKRQWISEVPSLRLPAELLIERELPAEGSRSNAIVAVVVQ